MPKQIQSQCRPIRLDAAVALLEQCSAVIIDDDVLVYPSFEEEELTCAPNAETRTEFMRLKWENEGLEFELSFEVENNQDPTISGSSLFLKDSKGEDCQLTLLVPQDLEAACGEPEPQPDERRSR